MRVHRDNVAPRDHGIDHAHVLVFEQPADDGRGAAIIASSESGQGHAALVSGVNSSSHAFYFTFTSQFTSDAFTGFICLRLWEAAGRRAGNASALPANMRRPSAVFTDRVHMLASSVLCA